MADLQTFRRWLATPYLILPVLMSLLWTRNLSLKPVAEPIYCLPQHITRCNRRCNKRRNRGVTEDAIFVKILVLSTEFTCPVTKRKYKISFFNL